MKIDKIYDENMNELEKACHPEEILKIKELLKMIEKTAQNAHKNGICVGICGVIASDKEIIPELLKMGIDEFSVSAKKVIDVKRAIQ